MRTLSLAGASGLAMLAAATPALAQETSDSGDRVADIVVTAQKRAQSLLDVPIAVTALGEEALTQARITSTMDLSAVVPNLTIMSTPGGINAPTFGMRGKVSQGTNPGQDKAVAILMDGVPFGGTYGAAFDLPDIERLEVLRGPQGTLFGRNSTAGAISVITRDPKGEFGVKQLVTVGNYNQLRTVTTVNTPQWGPFSAYVTYIHSERDGDIRNLGAGVVWDRSVAGLPPAVSAKTLGAHNSENIFAAVKFEPSDRFKMVYKYNRMRKTSSAEGFGLVWETVSTGSASALKTALLADPPLIAGSHRPKAVNNAFSSPGFYHGDGHSLVTTWEATDDITIKNTFGHQKIKLSSFTTLSGLWPSQGGVYKDASNNYLGINGTIAASRGWSWSDELQVNYDSEYVTLTAGGIYSKTQEYQGPPRVPNSNPARGLPRQPFGATYAGGVIPSVAPTDFFNKAHSLAAYVQGEFHVTPTVDLVAGYRITSDVKSGISYTVGNPFPFDYKDTRPTYLGGVNFKPNDDLLVYAKYSTGFVSGGSLYGYDYLPETVKSWEAGVKAGLFDRRLQVNLALFSSTYRNIQLTSSGPRLGRPELGSVIITGGDVKAKGFELETTLVPVRGLTLGANLGYTDQYIYNQDPFNVLCTGSCDHLVQNWVAKWTGQLSAKYETQPLFGDAKLSMRVDGNYRSRMSIESRRLANGHALNALTTAAGMEYSRAGWVVNGRMALQDIALAGGNVEIAAWARNLFNNDRPEFSIDLVSNLSTPYEPARTFGLDVTFKY